MEIIPVVNALILRHGKALLGKRSPEKRFFPNYWTVPGGKVEPGEKIAAALKREIQEETGLVIEKFRLLRLTEEFHDDHHHIVFDFLAEATGEPRPGKELVELSWVDKESIAGMDILEKDKKFLMKLDFEKLPDADAIIDI